MAESVTENGGFTQDLFSPLQFCEVVDERQQQTQQQSLQQLHQHQQSQLNQQQLTNLQIQQNHHHLQQQHTSQSQIQNQLQQQQSIKQETPQQSLQSQLLSSSESKSQSLINSVSSMEIIFSPSQVQLQSVVSPIVTIHHQPLSQPMYQVQLTRQQQQTIQQMQLNPLHLQSQPQAQNIHISQQQQQQQQQQPPPTQQPQPPPLPPPPPQQQLQPPQQQHQPQQHQPQQHRQQQQQQLPQQSQSQPSSSSSSSSPSVSSTASSSTSSLSSPPPTSMTVGAFVSVGISEAYTIPVATHTKAPLTNAVATQTTPTDRNQTEDDEPEIIFTNVSATTSETPSVSTAGQVCSTNSEFEIGVKPVKAQVEVTSAAITNLHTEAKPIPIKRTWRRPWKKKKEREKRQPVKKARRIKRRRIIVPKKNVIHVDPRHGPPIDTSNTLVERESEDAINQLKQKRQRIKLNRNSGREYINRLGKIVRARKIGSPCNCPLKCWDRMGSKILEIFNNFWDLCDFNLQNSYLFTCLKLCDVKRRYTKKPAEESRRQNTFEYFVRISGKHLRVCKKAFMSSHGLTSDKRLRTLFSQMKDGALVPEPDKRGKHLRPTKNQNGNHLLPHNTNTNHHNSSHYSTNQTSKGNSKQKSRYKKKQQAASRIDTNKQTMYTPPTHAVTHLHPHCTPPPPPAHGTAMQEPPHAYIPNGDIYFPGHYLEPPQAMAPHHMNQIPCQKMLETPAYFMAGMKENTFHQ